MPVVTVTTRYNAKLYGKPDAHILAEHKKYVRKQFEVTGHIDSKIITEGDPDKLGELIADQEFAIQSKVEVSEAKVAELKARDE